MSQFKIGDRVLMYHDCPRPWYGVIVSFDDEGDIEVLAEDNNWQSFHFKKEAILESVYNSPLYQALK